MVSTKFFSSTLPITQHFKSCNLLNYWFSNKKIKIFNKSILLQNIKYLMFVVWEKLKTWSKSKKSEKTKNCSLWLESYIYYYRLKKKKQIWLFFQYKGKRYWWNLGWDILYSEIRSEFISILYVLKNNVVPRIVFHINRLSGLLTSRCKCLAVVVIIL